MLILIIKKSLKKFQEGVSKTHLARVTLERVVKIEDNNELILALVDHESNIKKLVFER